MQMKVRMVSNSLICPCLFCLFSFLRKLGDEIDYFLSLFTFENFEI